jgi:hypothetical protein
MGRKVSKTRTPGSRTSKLPLMPPASPERDNALTPALRHRRSAKLAGADRDLRGAAVLGENERGTDDIEYSETDRENHGATPG